MTKEKILFFDCETSGFIKKSLSYDDPNQAWLVQIGAILTSGNDHIDEINMFIHPTQKKGMHHSNREIHYSAQQVHGFDKDYLIKHGVYELEVAENFGQLLAQADKIVCHNLMFDWQYVYQLMQRNIDDLSDNARAAFYVDRPSFCTMKDKNIIKFCNLKNKNNRPKWPKLTELHEILFGESFENSHDAFADIEATKNCYFELVKRGII